MNFDDFDNMKLHINTNSDSLDDVTLAKVNALREERNKYNKMTTDLQNQIDQIILEFNNFEGLVGKYFEITYLQSEENNIGTIIYCGPVTKVDRLYKSSCRIYASKFIKKYNYSEDEYNLKLYTNDSVMISKNNLNVKNYKEISKENFNNILDSEILKFKQSK